MMTTLSDETRTVIEDTASRLGVVPDVHSEDFIFRFLYEGSIFPSKQEAAAHYFSDGANSARQLADLVARVCRLNQKPITLLEFASGFGCVTRHLKHVLPASTIAACD